MSSIGSSTAVPVNFMRVMDCRIEKAAGWSSGRSRWSSTMTSRFCFGMGGNPWNRLMESRCPLQVALIAALLPALCAAAPLRAMVCYDSSEKRNKNERLGASSTQCTELPNGLINTTTAHRATPLVQPPFTSVVRPRSTCALYAGPASVGAGS